VTVPRRPVSIVVPVHNEEAILAGFLDRLTEGASPGELEVIVVCNGCTDGSATVARQRAGSKVIETPVGDKVVALRLGDAAATRFPRFYIDADVRVTLDSIRTVAAVLVEGKALAAAPRLKVDLSRSSRLVRAYYRRWLQTQWVTDNLVGSGFMGLSLEGHDRLSGFHPEGADDLWLSAHFGSAERASVREVSFEIPASRSIGEVISRRARILAANERVRPHLPPQDEPAASASHPRAVARWLSLPEALLYGVVHGSARLLAWRYLRMGSVPWNPDRRHAA
jgi:hypothetical protein